jgi:hypothetical protein
MGEVSDGDVRIDVLLIEDDDFDIRMEVWDSTLESPKEVAIVVVDFPVMLARSERLLR